MSVLRGLTRPRPDRRAAFALPAVMIGVALAGSPAVFAVGPARATSLADAGRQGAFNVGPARAAVTRTFESAVGGDVARLEYTVHTDATVGVFGKEFSISPADDRPNLVEILAAPETSGDFAEIETTLEIKGSDGVQRVAVPLRPGWTTVESLFDARAVGTLQELVLTVRRRGGPDPAQGAIRFDVRIKPLDPARALSLSAPARVGAVALAALLAALLAAAGRGVRVPRAGGFLGDVLRGVGWAVSAWLVVEVYAAGGMDALALGWRPARIALGGAAVGAWWTLTIAGRLPGPREAFRHAAVAGLLATAAASVPLLQPPGDWWGLLHLSRAGAAATLLVYLLAHVVRLATAGEGLGAAGAVLILGTPFVAGGLTLLEPGGLIDGLAGDREVVGYLLRTAVVFVFNVLLVEAHGRVTGRPSRSAAGFVAMLAAAAAATSGPWIASLGSGASLADWSPAVRFPFVLLATIGSQAGLWAEAYIVTGLALDALAGRGPSAAGLRSIPLQGAKKGMIYGGVFMTILYAIAALDASSTFRDAFERAPVPVAALLGALAFPMARTAFETFDGSPPFFERLARSYRDPWLYARGAVGGAGLAFGLLGDWQRATIGDRAGLGFLVGASTFAGVDLVRDAVRRSLSRGEIQPTRFYGARVALGGLIGAALGFYLDASQLAIVIDKFRLYTTVGRDSHAFEIYPLISKWGFMRLGSSQGGADLLFLEALAGALTWSTAAWLFALNRTFMAAGFERQTAPIRAMFSAEGLRGLGENSIYVARWGLWMSPIINSFLRPMGDPTWYNQDGAIRTVAATFEYLTTSPDAFRSWSLQMFVYLLAYDVVRVLIWIDHMGLRVATLVNLSFLGVDAGERRLARYLAPSATSRCIPEAVKRFATWGPLLLPFYIPRGADWDRAWSASERLAAGSEGIGPVLAGLSVDERLTWFAAASLAMAAVCSAARFVRGRFGEKAPAALTLRNASYELTFRDDGAVVATTAAGLDVSRRSYDLIDPAGRALFLTEDEGERSPMKGDEGYGEYYVLAGNPPGEALGRGAWATRGDALVAGRPLDDGRAALGVVLPADGDPVEVWTLTLTNTSGRPRTFRAVPYLEWVLNAAEADRNHTQYNRLFAEMEYVDGLRAVLAWDKHAKATGFLAVDAKPEGFLTSRMDFIGRAGSLASPRALETLNFSPARDEAAHPTLDPIAALLVGVTVPPSSTATLRFLVGATADKAAAVALIAKHLGTPGAGAVPTTRDRKTIHRIGHGEIPEGTPSPYCEFTDDGARLLVRTPYTPRPFDHAMSNALGHVVSVTNRGLHTSASVNAQQNRLTPDWADAVTKETPSEAIYLHDPASGEWFSPTFHPLNDPDAATEAEFGLDGTAVFRMKKGTIETELTVFVPPDAPVGVYLLTIRNRGDRDRRLRIAPYFQMVLADRPEHSGSLAIRVDETLGAIFFENPRNAFRTGPAFVATADRVERFETRRGRFFGSNRDMARPRLVDPGEPDVSATPDDRPIAAMLTTIHVPAGGSYSTVVLLGQADDRRSAEAVIRKFQDVADAGEALEATRRWWRDLIGTVRVESNSPEFDAYVDWLKYQALAERIWSRHGFYQASGAFGFRDQLQDSIGLLWVDPAIARRQILLHASQQFLEGDVVHWFHRLQDGRTGFAGRSHASDNLLWLAWAVVEYLAATGDESILDERTPYLESEQPFEPLPRGKGGVGFDPIRSTRSDTVYRHCLKAIDLVLDQRMGAHGLPLIGTGDWNDGLDDIGSEGRGESVWLALFLSYILKRFVPMAEARDGGRAGYHSLRLRLLDEAIQKTWRGDRYLRAIHDDGAEIGAKGSGVWEIDALTAAWAVMAGIDPERERIVFETALAELEQETTIKLGTPPLREDTRPYLGRSSWYPEGVRENGMYCHGVQWLVGAARVLSDRARERGDAEAAREYAETAFRLWRKIAAVYHAVPGAIETYGGQPNKQAADMVTTFDPGRMIWNGYTGAAGWMLRQALEAVLGLKLAAGRVEGAPAVVAEELGEATVARDVSGSPFEKPRPS